MNGYMTVTAIVTTPDGQQQPTEQRYELGDAIFLLSNPRYGLRAERKELSGPPEAPHFVIEGTTTREGHRFCYHAEFDYRPDESYSSDGLPYGFRFTGGRIGLTVPPHWDQDVKSLHELRETISRGEEHFRQQQLLAARDRALIDQVLAENPHLWTAGGQQ